MRDSDLIDVVHERWDVTDQALRLVKAQFELPPPVPDDKTFFDHLLKIAPQPRLANMTGNLADGEKLAETIVETTYLNSYVAHVQAKRVSCAVGVGLMLNPDGLRQQIEGGLSMSLGYALSEEIGFQGGRVLDRSFDIYPLPRCS